MHDSTSSHFEASTSIIKYAAILLNIKAAFNEIPRRTALNYTDRTPESGVKFVIMNLPESMPGSFYPAHQLFTTLPHPTYLHNSL